MNSKKFDRELYNQCDNKGKQVAIQLLQHFGYTLKDDSEAFKDRDLIMTKDNEDVWVEAEYSPSWKSTTWPSHWEMTCPARKNKSKAHLYIRTNASQTTAIVVPMQKVHSANVIRKDTYYTKNESFYSLPIDDCDVFVLSEPGKTNNRYIKS